MTGVEAEGVQKDLLHLEYQHKKKEKNSNGQGSGYQPVILVKTFRMLKFIFKK